MKLKATLAGILLLVACHAFAQEAATEDNGFWSRIFLPSIDVGYQVPNSSLLRGATKFGTSIEYRIRNNNDFFIRANYDTYGARYNLANNNNTTNTVQGTAQFTDIMVGPGYRLGDRTYRIMFGVMAGTKLYDFPTATVNGQQIVIMAEGKSIFTTMFLTTLEYYIDSKSAVTFSLYQNQVWQQVDFWQDGGSALGFSIGFITSLL